MGVAGMGVAGVAGKAKIMPLRIAYFDAASNSCYGYYSTIASGLTYAAVSATDQNDVKTS